ncbi:MAG: YbaB/EbfC family nucleoid-associated protein [Candidatus Andersenbacteria bacterium]
MVKINKLKQVWEMRKAAKSMQSALGDVLVVGEAEGGKVKIGMDGNQKITKVEIDPSLLVASEQERVQNGVREAFMEAQKQVQKIMGEKLRSGELKMPDLGM